MKRWGIALGQMATLAGVAAILGLGYNALRSDKNHVELTRNYFPKLTPPDTAKKTKYRSQRPTATDERPAEKPETPAEQAPDHPEDAAPSKPAPAPETPDNAPPPEAQEEPEIGEHGFQLVDYEEAQKTYHEPGYETGFCVFVDARDQVNYEIEHVPGAYLMDHYRREEYLPDLLPIVLGADRVVVYCGGGDCEDSTFAANDLLEAGVPWDIIYVYEGGISEWRERGGPIATGERNP